MHRPATICKWFSRLGKAQADKSSFFDELAFSEVMDQSDLRGEIQLPRMLATYLYARLNGFSGSAWLSGDTGAAGGHSKFCPE
jgi:hypothetical protein